MRKIEIILQKEEDIVFLQQGLNWIRQHIIKELSELAKLSETLKDRRIIEKTLDDHVESYDRIMTLISQLDKELEKSEKK
ncbi:MAG: hypothetical protein ACE5RP_00110 [Nitrosopumilus sp.]